MLKELNKTVSIEENNIDQLIQELMDREEYACTGDACAAHACGLYQVP